jgi:hypothetical protein
MPCNVSFVVRVRGLGDLDSSQTVVLAIGTDVLENASTCVPLVLSPHQSDAKEASGTSAWRTSEPLHLNRDAEYVYRYGIARDGDIVQWEKPVMGGRTLVTTGKTMVMEDSFSEVSSFASLCSGGAVPTQMYLVFFPRTSDRRTAAGTSTTGGSYRIRKGPCPREGGFWQGPEANDCNL